MVRLPKRFRLTIVGDTKRVLSAANSTNHLTWVIETLLCGREVHDLSLKQFGLTLEIDEDMDQGDD